MHVKMTPDEPGKLLNLIGKMMKIDTTAAKAKLDGLVLGGPGITLREKISDNEEFTLSIELPVDPQAKP